MAWYYAVNNQPVGPVEREQLAQLARDGQLQPSDLIWSPEFGDKWAAAASQTWLVFGPPAGPAAAEPPPTPASPAAAAAPRSAPPPHSRTGPAGTTPNRELTRQARLALRGRWGLALAVCLLHFIIVGAVGQIPFAAVFVAGPLALGMTVFFLTLLRRTQSPTVGLLFEGFRQFGSAILAQVLTSLFTFLWFLLLIVPGIVAMYSYTMTYYIMADNPGIHASEAIRRSKAIMRGHKWKLFCLQWRFFGWVLLSIMTFGIGFLWLIPYMQAASTAFYEDIRPA